MHENAKCVCLNYMQPQKVKFKSVQINMKHVSYYVYLPQSTHVNAHLETAFMRAFNFITRNIMTSVMYGFPSRTLLLKQQIS